MSFAAVQIAIENRFAINFTSCPVSYQNVPYEPTDDVAYCEFSVIDSYSQRADIGTTNPLHRSYGIINANFFMPLDVGTNSGRVLADAAAAVFRDQQFAGVTCRSPLVRNVGEVEGWFLVNMTCQFYYDVIYA